MYLNKRDLEGRLTEIINEIVSNEMEMTTKEDIAMHLMLVDKDTREMYAYPTEIVAYDFHNTGIILDTNKAIENYLYYSDLLNYKSSISNIGYKRILHEVEHDSIRIDGSLKDKIVMTMLHTILPDYAVLKVVNETKANQFKTEMESYIEKNCIKEFERIYRESHSSKIAM